MNKIGVSNLEDHTKDADPFADTAQCLNCGAMRDGLYCAACGQKRVRRLTFRRLLADAVRFVARVDSKFARTVIGMTIRPGQTAREYVEGKRWVYLNPIKYVLFTSTLFLLLIQVFDLEVWRLTPGQEEGREGFMLIFGLLTYLIFVNTMGPALVQRLAFRGRQKNLAECYVMALFSYGHLVFFFIVAAFLGAYNNFANYSVVVVGTMLFLAWTLVGFYQTRIWWAALTAFFMAISYYVFGAVTSIVIRFAINIFR